MTDTVPVAKSAPRLEPSLALLEFSSIAAGIQSADAMVKRAELAAIHIGTVQPGRFLILIGGEVAEVEEALKAGLEIAPDCLADHVFLPGVHKDVVRAITAGRITDSADALGIIETRTVPSAIHAADRAVKGAQVQLAEVRLADGLGGKGLVFVTGQVSDVEAALDLASAALLPGHIIRRTVIAQLHADIARLLRQETRFGPTLGWSPA